MDFGLKFEFARYLAVYRGIPRHTALPLPGGKNVAVGKKNGHPDSVRRGSGRRGAPGRGDGTRREDVRVFGSGKHGRCEIAAEQVME
jgi:hypothetical protein